MTVICDVSRTQLRIHIEGSVKWFSKDKGFGFISVSNSDDRFFHVTNVKGDQLPNNGDSVTFVPKIRKNGKLAAVDVVITSTNKKEIKRYDKPYYASGAYKSYNYTEEGTKGTWAWWLAIVFAVIIYWGFDGGFGWSINAAIIGVIAGLVIGKKEEKIEGTYEITSTCLRCGGTGHVTARSGKNIGFQCKDCKSFWKERDKYDE